MLIMKDEMPSLRTATSSMALPGRRKETNICHNNFYQSNDTWSLLTLTMNVRSWPKADTRHQKELNCAENGEYGSRFTCSDNETKSVKY